MTIIETNLAAFNSTLAKYMVFTSKVPQEVLEKKGRDLGIQLYRGFGQRKWGGAGKAPKGLARAELASRTAQKIGTEVRPSLLKEYAQKRAMILHDRRYAKWSKNMKGYLSTIRRAVSLWQSIVGREIGLRQKGIGVLAASFLWFRARSSQAKGTYYVRNNTGKPLGFAEVEDGSFRIVGETAGLQEVDARYGIVAAALDFARTDMVQYMKERHAAAFQQVFGEAPA